MTVGEMTPGEIQTYNGRPVTVAKNGALRDTETGRIVAVEPSLAVAEPTLIASSERGRELAWLRHHAPRQNAVLAAVRAATGDAAGELYQTVDDADGYLTQVIVSEIVLDSDTRGIDRAKAWQMVLEQSGMDGRAPKQAADSTAQTAAATVNKLADALLQLLPALAERRRDIIDGSVSDG